MIASPSTYLRLSDDLGPRDHLGAPDLDAFLVAGTFSTAWLGGTDDVAIEDRFFAGGSTTVRGFRDNRLGPRDSAGNPTGGNAQAIVNLEWRFPLWNWLGGAIFWDMGAIGREWKTLSTGDFRSGVGTGLRLKTPVGPIRLDFGYPLNPIAGDKPRQIYLSVGNPF